MTSNPYTDSIQPLPSEPTQSPSLTPSDAQLETRHRPDQPTETTRRYPRGASAAEPRGPSQPDETTRRYPHSMATAGQTAGDTGEGFGGGVRGAMAAMHGTGEALRGSFNRRIDEAFGEEEAAERNRQLEREGLEQIRTRRFSDETKRREGVAPREGERRDY